MHTCLVCFTSHLCWDFTVSYVGSSSLRIVLLHLSCPFHRVTNILPGVHKFGHSPIKCELGAHSSAAFDSITHVFLNI